jgi:hypothetical protein
MISTDLPDGTRAVVKIQRPPVARGKDLSLLIFAQGQKHPRTYRPEQMPQWVLASIAQDNKGYFNAQVQDGEWVVLTPTTNEDW